MRMQKIITTSMITLLLLGQTTVYAAPQGGVVTSGSASINQNGATTTINQNTQKTTINWQSFSIGSSETVNFVQPSSSSIALNRVVGNERSVISGALNANGQVWILNSNGVLFNKSAQINTAGLLTTTRELSDEAFNNSQYNFTGESNADIINLGTIRVSQEAYAVLAGSHVRNGGTIEVVRGKIALIGAEEYSISLNGNSIVELTIDKASLEAIVENHGAVIADGGEIIMKAQAVDEVFKGVVNNTGIVEATSLADIMGKVTLDANGAVMNSGIVDVSNEHGVGGEIRLTADETVHNTGILNARGVEGGFIALAAPSVIGNGFDVGAIGDGDAGWYYVGSSVEYARNMINPHISKSGTVSDKPFLFNENQGQFDDDVSFAAWGAQYAVSLSAADAAAYFSGASGSSTGIHFENANENIHAVGLDEKSSYSNYYLNGEVVEHVTDYGGVKYENIYDGIDLVYYTNKAGDLEHDLIVNAHADASQIAYNYGDATVNLEDNGDLSISNEDASITQKAPLVYQHTSQGRKIVASEYELDGNGASVVLLDEYDESSDLIVDPVVLWSSNIDGAGQDLTWEPFVDDSGVYVAGLTRSSGLSTDGTTFSGNADGFIQKLNHSGEIQWTTYYGSDTFDMISDIDVDDGSVYAAGITRSYSGLTGFTKDFHWMDVYDGFISSFSAADGTLNWDRQIGGNQFELGLEVDAYDGNVYYAGTTTSTSAVQIDGQDIGGTDRANRTWRTSDIFVGKFTSEGVIEWLKTIERTNRDTVTGLAVDSTGYYLGGYTWGRGILDDAADAIPWDKEERYDSSARNGILVKLDLNGGYEWARQIGGENLRIMDIELADGSLYAVGDTSDSDLNTFANNNAGRMDLFITKYDLDGGQTWFRYFGGIGVDRITGLSSNDHGLYLVGTTASEGLDPTGLTAFDGEKINYLAKFTHNGYLNWFKYQEQLDFSMGVAAHGNDFYVVRTTNPYWTSNIVIERHTEFPFESPDLLVALVQGELNGLAEDATQADVLALLNGILADTVPAGTSNLNVWTEFFTTHSESLSETPGYDLIVPTVEEEEEEGG